MSGIESVVRRLVLILPTTLLMTGCFHPGMYYGRPYGAPYGQPSYAPPQTLNPGSPGSLYIPESSEDPYAPGGESSYDADPDDFRKSDQDDEVPFPNDRTPFYGEDQDDLGPNTMLDGLEEATAARPVSLQMETRVPLEYGFDTAEYKWLRGQLQYSPESDTWQIVYSAAARDSYRGTFNLNVAPEQLSGLNDGDPVDVRGYPNLKLRDASEKPVYEVEEIRLMATRFAG